MVYEEGVRGLGKPQKPAHTVRTPQEELTSRFQCQGQHAAVEAGRADVLKAQGGTILSYSSACYPIQAFDSTDVLPETVRPLLDAAAQSSFRISSSSPTCDH